MTTSQTQQVYSFVAAVLTTLHELNTDCAESTLYLACGMSLSRWDMLRGIMRSADLIDVKSHRVSLTETGRKAAIRLEASLSK